MISIQKDDSSVPPTLNIQGVIDETCSFDSLFGNYGKVLRINGAAITRINSVGIKLWRDFFQKFRAASGKVSFVALSPALVSTLSYLNDFVQKSEIESIGVPFFCPKCKAQVIKVFTLAECQSLLTGNITAPCGTCGTPAELDEVPEEYLSFL